jgi:hypothetical protein
MKAEIGATVALDAANDVMVFPLWCWLCVPKTLSALIS